MMEPSMTSGAGERPLPRFFVQWRSEWGDKAADWTPTDYLNQQSSIGPAIAAGWLFNPATVEYRGGVFLAERFSAPNVDDWFERYPNEPSRIESVVNAVVLYDYFVNCDTDPYEDALPGLAADIGACWQGILTLRYPKRAIHIEVADGTDDAEYGPSVTFWTSHDGPGPEPEGP